MNLIVHKGKGELLTEQFDRSPEYGALYILHLIKN
jgi:hypothetical protein